MKIIITLWFSLFAASAFAQDFRIDALLIDRCLGSNQDAPMACVGKQARVCYDDYGGGADMVVGACKGAELAFWDKALNAAYKDLQVLVRKEQEMDVGYNPDQLTDAARAMQQSWIFYRDATCWLDVSRAYPFGSAASPASSGCELRETARQYFQLQDIAAGYRT